MWPFRKKSRPATTPTTFDSVLCIPGYWEGDRDLKLAVVEATDGAYIAAGGVMMHVSNECHFKLEVCERDEQLSCSFAAAGRVTGVGEDFLDEIDRHKLVVYLSATTGSLSAAAQIAFAAGAILKAGGIGVKIETAGKAFEKDAWLALTDNFQEHNLYEMFVVDSLYDSSGTTFSCGMQNLGFKDTIVSHLPFQDAVELIRSFGYYQIVDKPKIFPAQTFSATSDAPVFRIASESRQPYEGQDLFGNPFGMWRLVQE